MSEDNNTHTLLVRAVGTDGRVLELGAASGYMTQLLRERGCRVVAIEYDPAAAAELAEIADETVVGDLNDPAVLAGIDGEFDVVLAGDVLEHLTDPLGVLRAAISTLAPGGRVVISVPNMTHADLKVSLMAGYFDYRDTGLLDRTHIRFFTFETLMALLDDAGLRPIEVHRMQIPMFHTELALPPELVSAPVQLAALRVRESDTYQFIVTAEPIAADDPSTRAAIESFTHQTRLAAAEHAAQVTSARLSVLIGDAATAPKPDLGGTGDELRSRIIGMAEETATARRELLDACLRESEGQTAANRLHHLEQYQRNLSQKWAAQGEMSPDEPLEQIVEHLFATMTAELMELRSARAELLATADQLHGQLLELTDRTEQQGHRLAAAERAVDDCQSRLAAADQQLGHYQRLATLSPLRKAIDKVLPVGSRRGILARRLARALAR